VVTSCHDGDTFKATVNLGFNVQINETFRLHGIDAPELSRGGIPSRDYLSSLILNKDVSIFVIGKEKYGRWLARVTLGEKDISTLMLENSKAVPYGGGKRSP
jgi:endonuclease YncB( thermonuclease family)